MRASSLSAVLTERRARFRFARQHERVREHGLTLLEMVVVLFILAAVAVSAVALVDNADAQSRYDDTRVRFDILESAVIGEDRVNGRLSGFAVDTGEMPVRLADLFAASSGVFEPYGPKIPSFRGVAFASPSSEEVLYKGYRGPYVTMAPGETAFRDGWGNVGASLAVDADNFGWGFDLTADELILTSVGDDRAAGAVGGDIYAADIVYSIPRDVVSSSWQQQIAAVRFSIDNQAVDSGGAPTAVALDPALTGERVFLVVLSYRDSLYAGGSGAWLELESEQSLSEEIPAGVSDFTFSSAFVPAGEHLVFVAYDPGTSQTSDDVPYSRSGARLSSRFAVLPRSVSTSVKLTLR